LLLLFPRNRCSSPVVVVVVVVAVVALAAAVPPVADVGHCFCLGDGDAHCAHSKKTLPGWYHAYEEGGAM